MDNWISVDERLPEEGVPVLGYWGQVLECDTCLCYRGVWWWVTDRDSIDWDGERWVTTVGNILADNESRFDESPTHWQPLPEPPTPPRSQATEAEGW